MSSSSSCSHELSAIGLDSARGATTRLAWTEQAAAAAEWFDRTARRLGLEPELDRNGNRWAWSGSPATRTAAGPKAIVTGSHLDSVREGGRFDGALGVVVGLIAVHLLAQRGEHRADEDVPIVWVDVGGLDEESVSIAWRQRRRDVDGDGCGDPGTWNFVRCVAGI